MEGNAMRRVCEGLAFAESPRWHGGSLWFSDFYTLRVQRLDPASGELRTVCEVPGQPSGLGWLPDGRLLVAGMLQRKVYVVDDAGTIAVHSDLDELNEHMLNDMIVAADGTAYVSGFGWNMWESSEFAPSPIIRVRPDGTAEPCTEPLGAPNGMALSEDGEVLVVAEPAAGGLSRFTVTEDGDLVDRKVLPLEKAEGAAYVTPDGICLDADDHVWAADPMGQRMIRIAPDGAIVEEFAVDDHPLACVLAGPQRSTLYIAVGAVTHKSEMPLTPMGRLLATDVDVPGSGRP
jgi:sugar lactone lactonase YvrE